MHLDVLSIALLLLFFIVGMTFGSFGNVLIYRVPEGRTIMGRSQCLYCRRILTPFELIPLVSFLYLRGQCAGCGQKISLQYPLVELMSGFLFAGALLHTDFRILPAIFLAFAFWLLLLIGVVDAATQSIPDAFNIPFIIISGMYAVLTFSFDFHAILLGAGFFMAQWAVSGGKWLGSGDIFLGAGAGMLLGHWQVVLAFLFFAYVSGAFAASLFLLSGKKTLEGSLAFGPFIALGIILAVFFGDSVQMMFPF